MSSGDSVVSNGRSFWTRPRYERRVSIRGAPLRPLTCGGGHCSSGVGGADLPLRAGAALFRVKPEVRVTWEGDAALLALRWRVCCGSCSGGDGR